jgi:serine-type D-Ala-D-Ala carboxypeptidase/endopeptidase (penicillin-binding protein 4)
VSPTRTFALLLAVVALACAGLGLRSSGGTAAAGTTRTLHTPLWSPRRVPQPIVDAVGSQRLQSALDGTVGGTPVCFVVEDGGASIAEHAPDAPLIPASTQKLLTAAVALAVLGPDTHLETRVVAPKAPAKGTVDRIWLVGGGDPLVMTPDFVALRGQLPELRGSPTTSLAALADAVVAAGVKRIPGGVVGDDSRYETLRYIPTWRTSYRTDGEIGPLGALTVNGGFSAIRPVPQAVDDPAVYAAEELASLLRDRGVSIGRAATRGTAPANAVQVATIPSPAIKDLVGEILTTSDNLGAELLTREIGLHQSHQGTTIAGTQAITAELKALGLPTAGLTLVDGSGLDRNNRATCRLLAATLDLGAQPRFASLWSGLPIGGRTGTLVEELNGTPLDGTLHAKTGTLDNVTGLVGIVERGRFLRFSFVANGSFTKKGGDDLHDQIALVVAGFPDAPPADALVPAPATSRHAASTGARSTGAASP